MRCQGSSSIALAEGIEAGCLAPYAAKYRVHKMLGTRRAGLYPASASSQGCSRESAEHLWKDVKSFPRLSPNSVGTGGSLPVGNVPASRFLSQENSKRQKEQLGTQRYLRTQTATKKMLSQTLPSPWQYPLKWLSNDGNLLL